MFWDILILCILRIRGMVVVLVKRYMCVGYSYLSKGYSKTFIVKSG